MADSEEEEEETVADSEEEEEETVQFSRPNMYAEPELVRFIVVQVCSDDDGTVANSNGSTEIITLLLRRRR